MSENPSVSGSDYVAAGKNMYLGIFFVALSTLMYEILLTRIFSVTMGYHFAFMAISIAMFGMTVGAIIVYLYPKKFPQEKIKYHLAKNAFLFSITIVISFLIHLFVPFMHGTSIIGFSVTAMTYIVIAVPFVFSGICISLLLTRFSTSVNKLYAADLIGASLGCILVVVIINISGGPTSIFITAFITSLATLFFISGSENKKISTTATIYTIFIGLFCIIHTVLVLNNNPLLRIYWERGDYAEKPLYEKWNSFSRVSIDGDSTKNDVPFGWGLSNTYDRNRKVRQLMLNIDAHSTTVLSKFDGNLDELFHLRYDVSNIVQYLRHDADVMIIGSGGGRDVLSSLEFGQKSVLGIEINREMIEALNGDFGNFTGHLDKYPNIRFVGDEARSYIQRSPEKFDIIQVSVIDNWSATSSGAFVLTENALYTLETWKLFFDRLKPDGILTVTRFYRKRPAELYRIVEISTETLRQAGINNPREHLAILRCDQLEREKDRSGTGTILLSKKPFSQTELNTIDSVCSVFKFQKILTPSVVTDSVFALIAFSGESQQEYIKNFPINITPPNDDKPFFFHLLRLKDFFNRELWTEWDMEFNVKAIFILLSLFVIISILTVACIIIPLKLTSKNVDLKGSLPLFIFFGSIGFGFMLIEISQIQRLNIFLGHPTYSLAAALCTLLLSSGIGSYLSGIKPDSNSVKKSSIYRLAILLLILFLFGLFTPNIIIVCREYSTPFRIFISILILFPLGLFMGMAFPLGMKAASVKSKAITPWLWGINGITSVFASVISILIAMTYGISISYWTGTVLYLIAALSFIYLISRDKKIKV